MEEGQKVKCVVLKDYDGLLHWQTQTDTYFSREISDRVRVIACLTTIPNIVHSDNKGDTITSAEWHAIAKQTNAEKPDALILVWGNDQDTEMAVNEIIIRAKEATVGIPSETRQALSDGTNGFERILPGADRMYPDTDLPPMRVTSERVKKLNDTLPEKFWEREKWYSEIGVPEDCIAPLSVSKFAELFKYLVADCRMEPVFVSVALIQIPKRFKRKGFDVSKLKIEILEEIFELYNQGKIKRSAVIELMRLSIKHGKYYEQFIPKAVKNKEVTEILTKEIPLLDKTNKIEYKDLHSFLMGRIMKKYRFQVDGKEIASLVDEKLKEVM
jgi:glutamyl-tRNA(Gln) amidotransferase subunit E